MTAEHHIEEIEDKSQRAFEIIQDLIPKELLQRSDMLIGNHVVSITPNGEYEMGGGFPLPAVTTIVPITEIQKLNESAQKIASLEVRLKHGFYSLFMDDPPAARHLLKLVFPPKGYDDYIQLLSNLFEKNPGMCLSMAHSYRGDGRLKPDGEIAFNEVNAFPGGVHWVSELAKYLKENYLLETYGLENLENYIASEIQTELPKINGGIFFPTEDLSGYKVVEETLAMARTLREKGFKCVIGEPNSLKTNGEFIYVPFRGEKIRISYIDGVSSPTTFARYPEVVEAVSRGIVTCPAIPATTLSITNKGMFCLITLMRDGSIDPRRLGISREELTSLAEPIPDTYWVNTLDTPPPGKWVLKPFDGAGGDGVIIEPSESDWQNVRDSYLAQVKLKPIRTVFRKYGKVHEGSIDPYLVRSGSELQIHGFISRGSVAGTLSNVSAHSQEQSDAQLYLENHLGIVVS